MSTSPREILSQILNDLRSEDSTLQLAAMRNLGRLPYSSEAVVHRLEWLAIHAVRAVRQMALDVLDSRPSQYVRSQTLKHMRPHRLAILAEAEDWVERGLIEPEVAEVLVRRYDTSRKPISSAEAAEIEAPVPEPVKRAAAPAAPEQLAKPEKPEKLAAPAPTAPAPTLGERLLSQTSINIALYLGAFLVVGAAAILAALVEVTRLPILLGGTALFAIGAVAVKRRLPQPSFVLFMIFSFLLPISANVLADSLHVPGQSRDAYWAAACLLMAVAWGFGTWLYASRTFSFAAFAAWAVAVYRVGALGGLSDAWNGVGLVVAALGGLAGTHVLKAWKDRKFALPIFLSAQALVAGALLWSAWYAATALFDTRSLAAGGTWIAMSLTCVAGAVFYVWSAMEYVFPLFAWAAPACLLPVLWLFLRSFEATSVVESIGLWAWGAVFAAAAEASRRTSRRVAGEMHTPLLLGSLLLLSGAVIGGLLESPTYAFAIAAAAALVCTAMTVLRPRRGLWLAALIFGLVAYFAVFALPFTEALNVYAGYRLLGASLLLLLPELLFRTPFVRRDPWRGPLLDLGVIAAAINVAWIVLSGNTDTDPKAIIMAVYAVLLAAYALHMRRTWIGYLATASASASATYAVQRYGLDGRMLLLTGVSAVFFVCGFVLRRYNRRERGSVLRLSGLALGAIVTAVGFADRTTWEQLSTSVLGFDVLAVAILFFVEAHVRLDAPIEASGPFFASLASYLILRRFGIPDLAFHLLAFSLIWLTADMMYSRTLKPRQLGIPTRIVGGLLTLANVPALLYYGYQDGRPEAAAIVFLVYAMFFAFSAWFYRVPSLTFACTAGLSLGILLEVGHLNTAYWPAALTSFALLCYVAGYLLRGARGRDWGSALRISGLAVVTAVVIGCVYLLRGNVAWCALLAAGLFLAETYVRGEGRVEIGAPALLSAAVFLGLRDLHVTGIEYYGLVISLVWLAADLLYAHTRDTRPWADATRFVGAAVAAGTALMLIAPLGLAEPRSAALCFGIYAAFFAVYAWLYQEPRLGYLATASLPLATYFLLRSLQQDNWLYGVGVIALLLYAAGYMLRRGNEQRWSRMLLLSGLIIGTVNSISAPLRGGLDSAIPVALAATLFAAEAFARQNVWLAFPANALYLESYFLILLGLEVDQPQFFSIGAAILGMLMHYLLVRSRNPRGAFMAGLFSQLVLLGTTFIQLLSTKELGYFVVILFQGLAVLTYGIIARSRSLVIAPIAFIVVSVIAVLYTALKGIGTVVLIGGAGIILLLLGITAVLLRERIAIIGDRLSAWQA
jgi:hypothetical protein